MELALMQKTCCREHVAKQHVSVWPQETELSETGLQSRLQDTQGEGSPNQIDYRKKGTLVPTSLLEHLAKQEILKQKKARSFYGG